MRSWPAIAMRLCALHPRVPSAVAGQDTASLLSLRKNLPAELLERSARLRIVYGWVHAIGGQFQQAKQLLEGFNDRDRKEHEGRIYALKAFILRGEGFVQPALAMADKALAMGSMSTQAQLVTQIVRSSALCAAGSFRSSGCQSCCFQAGPRSWRFGGVRGPGGVRPRPH